MINFATKLGLLLSWYVVLTAIYRSQDIINDSAWIVSMIAAETTANWFSLLAMDVVCMNYCCRVRCRRFMMTLKMWIHLIVCMMLPFNLPNILFGKWLNRCFLWKRLLLSFLLFIRRYEILFLAFVFGSKHCMFCWEFVLSNTKSQQS